MTAARRTVLAAAAVALLAGCGARSHRPSPPIALLKAVRAEHSGAADRVVFAFRSAPRSVRLRWTRRGGLIQDGSGARVHAAGRVFLVVRFEPASGFDLARPGGEATYHGQRRFRPAGTKAVTQLVRLGDFEAVLTWAIGLDRRRPFTVERHGPDVEIVLRAGR